MKNLLRHILPLALLLSVISTVFAEQLNSPDELPTGMDPDSNQLIPGKFVWCDLFAEYPFQAAKFYSQVFGWSIRRKERSDSTYWMLYNGERPIGGVVRHDAPEKTPGGLQARWVGYISVLDLEKAAQQIVNEGGKLLVPPREVPDRGSMAIVMDRRGTIIGLQTSASGDPPDREANLGDWIWVQLFSTNPKDSVSFYKNVFGLDSSPDTRTEQEGDFLLTSDGIPRASVVSMDSTGTERGGWMGYVLVDDIEARVKTATKIGGRVLQTTGLDATEGKIAVIADPFGGVIGLYQNP